MSKERPILFSGPMVRAILDGRKTQTRRVVKCPVLEFVGAGGQDSEEWNDPKWWGYACEDGDWVMLEATQKDEHQLPCPYGVPGDRLWVRETIACVPSSTGEMVYVYRADGESAFDEMDETYEFLGKWKPSIHMPRDASRITLEVKAVRVERLHQISYRDAVAEGIEIVSGKMNPDDLSGNWKDYTGQEYYWNSPKDSFHSLWASINGEQNWADNPWVWVVEFDRTKP